MHDLRKGKAWNPHCRLLRQNYCYSIQLKIERISHSSSSSNIRAKYGSWCQVKERPRPGSVPLISVSTQQEQLRRQQQQQRYQISNKYMFGTEYRYTLGTFSDHSRAGIKRSGRVRCVLLLLLLLLKPGNTLRPRVLEEIFRFHWLQQLGSSTKVVISHAQLNSALGLSAHAPPLTIGFGFGGSRGTGFHTYIPTCTVYTYIADW